ncbi:MAG TPA: helix-turn-helix domain-containing protein [Streptosporangiaceae bacterium]|nr:helix-turn-helix domain-containing protein [Streptosporangiaceae bacterium]
MPEKSIAAGGPRSIKRITDPKALRALAHPIRMSLIGLLRTEGPLTATRAAELLGESSATCSFHLRQLGKYGMAEEATGGQGRERPWQATTMSTDVPDFADDPDLAAASGLYRSVLAERYFDWLKRWLDQQPAEPAEWQRAELFGDKLLYLTVRELSELGQKLHDVFDEYVDRTARPELRPPDSRLISVLQFAFPVIGPLGAGAKPPSNTGQADEPATSGQTRPAGDAR